MSSISLYKVFGCTNMRKEKDTDKLYLLILARSIYRVGGYFFKFQYINWGVGDWGCCLIYKWNLPDSDRNYVCNEIIVSAYVALIKESQETWYQLLDLGFSVSQSSVPYRSPGQIAQDKTCRDVSVWESSPWHRIFKLQRVINPNSLTAWIGTDCRIPTWDKHCGHKWRASDKNLP